MGIDSEPVEACGLLRTTRGRTLIWSLRDDEGNRWIGGIPLFCAEVLANLGKVLRTEDPEVRERLMPEVYSDPEDQAQWERYAQPDLKRLFAGRLEIVEDDLRTLCPLRDASAGLFQDGFSGASPGMDHEDAGGVESDEQESDTTEEMLGGDAGIPGAFSTSEELMGADEGSPFGMMAREAYIFRVGKGHESAWLTTLNAARHALFVLHGLHPSDMERHPAEFRDRSRFEALLQIEMLGQLQLMLIEE